MAPPPPPNDCVDETTLVIPCFNEAERLPRADITALVASPRVRLLLVNDGSTDATLPILHQLADEHDGIEVINLATNRGKAEAVRIGMQYATARRSAVVGYCDADMATPVDELLRLDDLLGRDPSLEVLLATRVALLGHQVDRSIVRHYLGRLFATASSAVLHIRVYDTQCGAKFFRNSPAFRTAISEPFNSRWAFDVELLGRLLAGGRGQPPMTPDSILEVPLKVWSDVAGSKLTPLASLRAGADLFVIWRALNAWRATS